MARGSKKPAYEDLRKLQARGPGDTFWSRACASLAQAHLRNKPKHRSVLHKLCRVHMRPLCKCCELTVTDIYIYTYIFIYIYKREMTRRRDYLPHLSAQQ